MSRDELQTLLQAQRSAFESCMKTCLDSFNTRIDNLFTQLGDVRSEVKALRENSLGSQALEDLNNKLDVLERHSDYLENQSRRNDLRIEGITEAAHESWEVTEVKVKNALVETLATTRKK